MMNLLATGQAVPWGEIATIFFSAFTGTLLGSGGIFMVWIKYGRQRELEKFKSKLAIEATEHQTRFEYHHQRLAETIGEVYAKFLEIRYALQKIVDVEPSADDPSRDEGREEFYNAIFKFQDYFRPLRIFLPKSLSDDIWHAVEQARNIEWDVPPGSTHSEYTKAWQRVGRELDTIQKQLESKFRDALGVGSEGEKKNPAPT